VQRKKEKSEIQLLADAITNAILCVKSPEDKQMNKFVTRQSVARDLPQFTGDPIEWPNFKCQFFTSTEACGFSNVENMSRLQKSLKGKARDVVVATMASPDNVERVMKTLENYLEDLKLSLIL